MPDYPMGLSMQFIPNSHLKQSMCSESGVTSIDELFSDIPTSLRLDTLNLEKSLSQHQVEDRLRSLGSQNTPCTAMPSFLGGGIKAHYIPPIVSAILSRSEFYTSYTPYQPEASQGFLQAMFEYQSIISELTGMKVANASLYDGATALGEAALMAQRITKRNTICIPQALSWEKKSILSNYLSGTQSTITEIRYHPTKGTMDRDDLEQKLSGDVSAVYVENPNYFGLFEDEIQTINELVSNHHALLIVGVDPLSLGIVKPPAEYGADIVIGEGRCCGNAMDFGGSSLGIFACTKAHVRQIPGRIIGMTTDTKGTPAFCMTMQTREQHIRRGKATSNICTNEGLNALAATVYLSWLGGEGLEQLGKQNITIAHGLMKKLTTIKGYTSPFTGTPFNEFVIKCPDPQALHTALLAKQIHGGLLLDHWFPALQNCMLFGATEMHSETAMATLVDTAQEVC